MAEKYPYLTSPGHVTSVLAHLRRTFPPKINSDTLSKLGLAKGNESHMINLLRFLNLVDDKGNRTELSKDVFSMHSDAEFHQEFSKIVANAYADLFSLHGDATWKLSREKLITYFRKANSTSERVGTLQASTFQRLASFAGQLDRSDKPSAKTKRQTKTTARKRSSSGNHKSVLKEVDNSSEIQHHGGQLRSGPCFTVRIEINLPANADQATYDNIFRSIKENLLNG